MPAPLPLSLSLMLACRLSAHVRETNQKKIPPKKDIEQSGVVWNKNLHIPK